MSDAVQDNKKTGRLAGIFIFLMVATGIPGVLFREIGTSMLEEPNLLQLFVEKSMSMRLSIMLSVGAGIFGTIFSVIVYQVLKQYSSFVATLYLVLWVVQVAISLVGDVSHYILLETAQYISTTNKVTDFYPLASFGIKGYVGSHFLGLIFYSGSFIFLHAQLLRFGLLPKWLSIWGMLATGTVFTVTWLQIFDQSVSFHFYNQNGIFMLTFTAFMLIKGFAKGRLDKAPG